MCSVQGEPFDVVIALSEALLDCLRVHTGCPKGKIMAIIFYDSFSKQRKSRNFGDDLNPWLLSKLFPKSLVESKTVCVIGIGTILNDSLNDRVATYDRKVVFTSGVGYGNRPPDIDESWFVSCVRGPLSASAHEALSGRAITDGALLLADFFEASINKTAPPIFIPHIHTHWSCGRSVRKLCLENGIEYLSPDVPQAHFISRVNAARFAICEAMHGAIVADTLRTPWVAVKTVNTLEFKWRDWCASMEVPFVAVSLPMLWDTSKPVRGYSYCTRKVKTYIFKMQIRRIVNEKACCQLSSAEVFKERLQQLTDARRHIERCYA